MSVSVKSSVQIKMNDVYIVQSMPCLGYEVLSIRSVATTIICRKNLQTGFNKNGNAYMHTIRSSSSKYSSSCGESCDTADLDRVLSQWRSAARHPDLDVQPAPECMIQTKPLSIALDTRRMNASSMQTYACTVPTCQLIAFSSIVLF